jgi:enamine deaminase RidA (YjgF/YER057c/UK114 family)
MMGIQRLNPKGLATPETYSQVVTAQGEKFVFVSGQVALDERGDLVGAGDVGEQVRQAWRNIKAALAAVDARPEDIVKTTTLVVNHRPELLPVISEARRQEVGDLRPASTLIGVQSLARPEYLVEVEAVALVSTSGGESSA